MDSYIERRSLSKFISELFQGDVETVTRTTQVSIFRSKLETNCISILKAKRRVEAVANEVPPPTRPRNEQYGQNECLDGT